MASDQDNNNRLFQAVLLERARATPSRIFMSVARTADLHDGFDDITYGQVAQAIDRCAHWLEERLGTQDEEKVIFASLGRQDVRGLLLMLAAPRTGHVIYWPQPFDQGRQAETMAEALGKLSCTIFLRPSPCLQAELVDAILGLHPMRTVAMPALSAWLSPCMFPAPTPYPYPYPLTPECASTRAVGIFQTSGTTSSPKAVRVLMGAVCRIDSFRHLDPPCEACWLRDRRVLSTFGWYQLAGFLFNLVYPILWDFVPVMAPQLAHWEGHHVAAAAVLGVASACLVYPATCVQVARGGREQLDALGRLDVILFSGSTVPRWAGRAIIDAVQRQHGRAADTTTRFAHVFGSTEAAVLPQAMPRCQDDWPYVRLYAQTGAVFRPRPGLDDRFRELVLERGQESHQPVFVNFPGCREWNTGDLFQRHADGEQWLPAGRVADLLPLRDGSNSRVMLFNPFPAEVALWEHPTIRMAMVAGHSRDGRLVLLISPWEEASVGEERDFVRRIWPFVCSCFPSSIAAMLDPEAVHVTPNIPCTGWKWNVNRKLTMALHGRVLKERFGLCWEEGPGGRAGSE